MGWGKTGPAHSFPPPPLGSNLSINLSVLGLNYPYTESEHSWLTYLKEKFKLQAFSQMILLNRSGERLGRPILSPLYYFLTLLFISQSLGLTYSCTVSEHSWLSCPMEKFKLRKHLANCMFLLNSGVGKDWACPFFPPPLHWVLTVQFICQSLVLTTLTLNLNTHDWHVSRRNFKLQAFSQMILLNRGWGKDWAGPFFPPSIIF